MQKIIREEFGVRIEVLDYHTIGPKLKGMRSEKPFMQDDEIRINVGENLCKVTSIKYYSIDTNQELDKANVYLDTDKRIGGVLVNQKEVLLLKVERPDKFFYCFPGGHVRENETIEECLQREMMEETNIDISNHKIQYICKLQSEGFGPEEFFLIDIGDKKIEFQDEHPEDPTIKLVTMPIEQMIKLDNVLPKEVFEELKKLFR